MKNNFKIHQMLERTSAQMDDNGQKWRQMAEKYLILSINQLFEQVGFHSLSTFPFPFL